MYVLFRVIKSVNLYRGSRGSFLLKPRPSAAGLNLQLLKAEDSDSGEPPDLPQATKTALKTIPCALCHADKINMFDNTCIDIVTYYQTIIFKQFCWGTAYPEEDGNMLSWPDKSQAAGLAGRQRHCSMAATTKGCKQFFQSAFKESLQPAVRLRSTSAFFSSVYF